MRVLRGQRAEAAVKRLETRQAAPNAALRRTVGHIVSDVRRNGDAALRRHAVRLDRLGADQCLRVSDQELRAALERIPGKLRRAMEQAANNIRRFCKWQRPRPFTRERRGIMVGQLIRPLAAVGCCVPGGRYPLPSSLLMTVIPAQVAGVPRIAVASPHPADATLAAAALLGIPEFYRAGGAQAIAALAYGTESIAPVVKIVGPGNRYVTEAKNSVAFDCAIDMLAGPTEVLVLAQGGDPRFIAADLVAQAEHDPDALVLFVTTGVELAREVAAEIRHSARGNSTAIAALANGLALVAETVEDALAWTNRIAPEHLTIPPQLEAAVTSAGSVFVGEYSPQAIGDYASGPNHVLPTGGAARFRGGLSVHDFLKIITVQRASAKGLRAIEPVVTTLADAEGLFAHADSVRVRCAHA